MACVAAAPCALARGLARQPQRHARAQRVVVRAHAKESVQDAIVKGATLAGLSAALLSAGSAQAAMEVANIAASDNRLGVIALLAVPVVGWVGFNMLGPLQNQLNEMGEKNGKSSKKSFATAVGLGAASLLAAQSAEAAQQVADLAASDNRAGILALLAVPAIGWVGFNILGPLQNQLATMDEKKGKKSLAVGLGLGAASLLAAQSAEAAQQVALVADGDSRGGILALLALPAIGWVAFNILGPLQNQLKDMDAKKGKSSKKSVAAGLGLGAASLLATQSAEAAQQVADLAASDGRAGILALLAVPAIGWVGFNILGPLQNQLANMDEKKGKKSLAVGLGLGAASLLAAQSAEAAQQVADLAASDGRAGILALLAVPAIGWVGFNILGPLQNQLAMMDEKKGKKSLAVGLGLGAASMLAAGNAEAAQQVADLAASDNRLGTIALLALPVVGWVGFNMLGPLQNQLKDMGDKNGKSGKKSVAAGLGLGAASLLAAQSAEAAQQVADLAASDGRAGILALLAVPAIGWVGFNILGPLQNQLATMDEKNSK